MKTVYGVALFAGRDPVSGLIRSLTRSRWSHVAVLLKDENDALWCFEATGSMDDLLRSSELPCVKLTRWNQVLEEYSGRVAVRLFQHHPLRDVSEFVNVKVGVLYEQHLGSLVRALARANVEENSDSFFCSELVAATLQQAGCLTAASRLADNYLPRDFAPETEMLYLEQGVVLSQLVVYKKYGSKWCCTS